MSEAERCTVAESVVRQVRGRVPVVVQVGALTTRAACCSGRARRRDRRRRDEFHPTLLLQRPVPKGSSSTTSGRRGIWPALLHLQHPRLDGVNVAVDIVRDLIRAVPNLRGMKYTAYDMYSMRKIVELDEGRFNVLSGADEVMLPRRPWGQMGPSARRRTCCRAVFVDAYTAFWGWRCEGRAGAAGEDQLTVSTFLSFPLPGGRQGDHAVPWLQTLACLGRLSRR